MDIGCTFLSLERFVKLKETLNFHLVSQDLFLFPVESGFLLVNKGQQFNKESVLNQGSEAQWLARRTRDPAVAGSNPTTAHVVIALGKQFIYISSAHPSAKWVHGYRQLK